MLHHNTSTGNCSLFVSVSKLSGHAQLNMGTCASSKRRTEPRAVLSSQATERPDAPQARLRRAGCALGWAATWAAPAAPSWAPRSRARRPRCRTAPAARWPSRRRPPGTKGCPCRPWRPWARTAAPARRRSRGRPSGSAPAQSAAGRSRARSWRARSEPAGRPAPVRGCTLAACCRAPSAGTCRAELARGLRYTHISWQKPGVCRTAAATAGLWHGRDGSGTSSTSVAQAPWCTGREAEGAPPRPTRAGRPATPAAPTRRPRVARATRRAARHTLLAAAARAAHQSRLQARMCGKASLHPLTCTARRAWSHTGAGAGATKPAARLSTGAIPRRTRNWSAPEAGVARPPEQPDAACPGRLHAHERQTLWNILRLLAGRARTGCGAGAAGGPRGARGAVTLWAPCAYARGADRAARALCPTLSPAYTGCTGVGCTAVDSCSNAATVRHSRARAKHRPELSG